MFIRWAAAKQLPLRLKPRWRTTPQRQSESFAALIEEGPVSMLKPGLFIAHSPCALRKCALRKSRIDSFALQAEGGTDFAGPDDIAPVACDQVDGEAEMSGPDGLKIGRAHV